MTKSNRGHLLRNFYRKSSSISTSIELIVSDTPLTMLTVIGRSKLCKKKRASSGLNTLRAYFDPPNWTYIHTCGIL